MKNSSKVNLTTILRRTLLAGGCTLLVLGCAKPAPAPPPVPQTSFAFAAPESCKGPGSSKVTFAIVAPLWTPGSAQTSIAIATATPNRSMQALYDDFSRSMRDDFLSLATCKGFSTKGPFATYDEMVFPDRTGADLVLVPEISVRVTVQTTSEAASMSTGELIGAMFGQKKPTPATMKGTAMISGRVTLAVKESITNTRMWTRNIEIPSESVSFIGERQYPLGTPTAALDAHALSDNGLLRVLGPRMQAIYQRVLTASWNNLDIREMEMVRKQSLEPRAKAGIVITK